MEFIRGHKVLSEKETGLGGKWYLLQCGENAFAYGTLADIESKYFVPVKQYGTKEEIKKRCESIAKLSEKNINDYTKKIIKEKNPEGKRILIEEEKRKLEAMKDFAEKLS